jgi:uncharacterized protein
LSCVKSPLLDCGLEKQEIRSLAKALGLESWNRPAGACLASRFPYGERLTGEKVEAIAQAEAQLLALGLRNVRVRYHGPVARIEVSPAELPGILNHEFLQKISRAVKACGFTYVALDLDGYRTGSLNEVLQQ